MKINDNINIYNTDCMELMPKMADGCIDVICIDPPYLYLKNQKLERPFDEVKFFSECKRLLTKNGFIVLFGRGTSFYRWNTILDTLGFVFKEEIVWNKRRISSPALSIGRVHETVSIHSKGEGKINKVLINYGELKGYDIDKIYADIKRLGGLFNKGKQYNKVVANLEKVRAGESYRDGNKSQGYKITFNSQLHNKCISTYTLLAMENGCMEQSIISDNGCHYANIHPTQKPVRLIERLLALVIPKNKTHDEIVVADFFGGSMSCMEAVHNMRYKGIACEIDEEYFESGRQRLEKLLPVQQELFKVA